MKDSTVAIRHDPDEATPAQGSAEAGMREPGLRERKKLATRRALHRAALELVVEQGMEHVSVDEVAARAGVSRRTFFNHFPSLEQAFDSPEPVNSARLAEVLMARPVEEPAGRAVRAVIQAWLVDQYGDGELLALRKRACKASPEFKARLSRDNSDAVTQLVDALCQRHPDRERLEMAVVVGATIGTFRAAMAQLARSAFSDDPTATMDAAFETLSRLDEEF